MKCFPQCSAEKCARLKCVSEFRRRADEREVQLRPHASAKNSACGYYLPNTYSILYFCGGAVKNRFTKQTLTGNGNEVPSGKGTG